MKINIESRIDWLLVKEVALQTQGLTPLSKPDSEWKRKILISEDSPIRVGQVIVRVKNIKSFIIAHMVRHKHGAEHFVRTLREDINEHGGNITRDTPNSFTMVLNPQAIINISKKRLCIASHKETVLFWREVVNTLSKTEPELSSVCVPECVYRGFCPTFKNCGYIKTVKGIEERAKYVL